MPRQWEGKKEEKERDEGRELPLGREESRDEEREVIEKRRIIKIPNAENRVFWKKE